MICPPLYNFTIISTEGVNEGDGITGTRIKVDIIAGETREAQKAMQGRYGMAESQAHS